MTDKIYHVPADMAAKAHIDAAKYKAMYEQSVSDPDGFWMEHGKRIDWIKPYTKAGNWTSNIPMFPIKWFEDGTLNVSANCIDRHLEKPWRSGRHHLGRRRSRTTMPRSPTANFTSMSAASPTP